MEQLYSPTVVERIIPVCHYLGMINLTHIRETKGLTQSQLAGRIGASQATISKIEAGEANPTLQMLSRLAQALDVHPSDLFARSDLEARAMKALSELSEEKRAAAVTVLETMAQAAPAKSD